MTEAADDDVTHPESETEEARAHFHSAGVDLAGAVSAALPGWIAGCLARFGVAGDPDTLHRAALDARAVVDEPLLALLSLPIDEQRTTPMAIVRKAVVVPTRLLEAAGVPAVTRDPFDERAFPADLYGLSPASWVDVGDEVAEAGMRWSVIKAFLHARLHGRPTSQAPQSTSPSVHESAPDSAR